MTETIQPNYILRQLIDGKFKVVHADCQLIDVRDVMRYRNSYCEIWARSVVQESYKLIAFSAPQ